MEGGDDGGRDALEVKNEEAVDGGVANERGQIVKVKLEALAGPLINRWGRHAGLQEVPARELPSLVAEREDDRLAAHEAGGVDRKIHKLRIVHHRAAAERHEPRVVRGGIRRLRADGRHANILTKGRQKKVRGNAGADKAKVLRVAVEDESLREGLRNELVDRVVHRHDVNIIVNHRIPKRVRLDRLVRLSYGSSAAVVLLEGGDDAGEDETSLAREVIFDRKDPLLLPRADESSGRPRLSRLSGGEQGSIPAGDEGNDVFTGVRRVGRLGSACGYSPASSSPAERKKNVKKNVVKSRS